MEWNGEEKRRFIRGEIYCKVFVYQPQPHILGAYTKNISEGGLRAVFNEKLEISSIVNLELFLHEEPIICPGKVIWVKDTDGPAGSEFPCYDTGIEFLKKEG